MIRIEEILGRLKKRSLEPIRVNDMLLFPQGLSQLKKNPTLTYGITTKPITIMPYLVYPSAHHDSFMAFLKQQLSKPQYFEDEAVAIKQNGEESFMLISEIKDQKDLTFNPDQPVKEKDFITVYRSDSPENADLIRTQGLYTIPWRTAFVSKPLDEVRHSCKNTDFKIPRQWLLYDKSVDGYAFKLPVSDVWQVRKLPESMDLKNWGNIPVSSGFIMQLPKNYINIPKSTH